MGLLDVTDRDATGAYASPAKLFDCVGPENSEEA